MKATKPKNPNWGGKRDGSGRKSVNALVPVEQPQLPFAPRISVEQRQAEDRSGQVLSALLSAVKERARQRRRQKKHDNPFTLPHFPPGAMPTDPSLHMAMDEAGLEWASTEFIASSPYGLAEEGLVFLGYPYLSQLAQRAEYRTFSETIATEMTRKWINITATTDSGEDGKGETTADKEVESRIKELKDFMEHLEVRDRFSQLALKDGWFGRAHLRFDSGDGRDEELQTPIGNGRDQWTEAKVGKGFLKGLQVIEPVWCYPTTYNATTPTAPDWYNPQFWYVLGKQFHRSRLLPFVGREVPDLLKPSYSFGGLALSQIAKPYVDIWLTTRQSVADLVKSFSTMVLSTNMATMMTPQSANNLLMRLDLYDQLRDNNGVFAIDKSSEEFSNVQTSLSGLHELQSQSQEHMMSVARIPAVKFTGMSPQGMNASSEGEIRAFYDSINAFQGKFFRPGLTTTIDFAMITLWGERDPRIQWDFVSLWEQTEKEKGEKRKHEAETGKIFIDAGVIDPAEERARIANDPDSGYRGIDPDDVPEPPAQEGVGLEDGEKPDDSEEGGGAEDADPFSSASPALDAGGFEESDHPRDEDGKFASGGGSSGGTELTSESPLVAALKFTHEGGPDLTDAQNAGLIKAYGSIEKAWKAIEGIGPKQAKQIIDATKTKAEVAKVKKTAFGGLWKSGEDNPAANFQMNAAHVLGKPTNAGSSYRQMLAFMIKTAASHGHGALVPAITKKLAEAFMLAGDKAKMFASQSDGAEAAKLLATSKKAYDEATKLYKGIGQEPPLSPQAHANSEFAKKLIAKAEAPEPAKPDPKQQAKALVDKVTAGPKPTAAELEKAKSKYPLGQHILPFVPEATLKTFNDHYSGDKAPTTPEGLAAKVTAFKVLSAVNDQKKVEAEADAQKKAAQQKAKEVAEAKANAEKNKTVMKDLGINEQEAEGFNALVKMTGGNTADVVASFKKYEDEAKGLGYPISGFEAAMIKNYSNGGYTAVNAALRAGTMTTAQHVYVKMVNQAIKKMPLYTGQLQRGTHLSSEQQAKYLAGNVVIEEALTSTSISNPFGGNTHFKITAIGKRATHIKKLSHYKSEDEVLYAARTFFKVTKVEGKPGGTMTVHMEELDD